jgi:hypothetical protein
MTHPVYETNITFEEIDLIIRKVFPLVANEPAPIVVAALIAMVVMAMNPDAEGAVLIKQIEEVSQFITMNLTTSDAMSTGSITLN